MLNTVNNTNFACTVVTGFSVIAAKNIHTAMWFSYFAITFYTLPGVAPLRCLKSQAFYVWRTCTWQVKYFQIRCNLVFIYSFNYKTRLLNWRCV